MRALLCTVVIAITAVGAPARADERTKVAKAEAKADAKEQPPVERTSTEA